MYSIEGNSVNELCYLGFELLEENGKLRKSDKGTTLELRHVTSKLKNPKNRYLNLNGRNNSLYAMIAECFWVLSGSDIVDGFLESYLHRAKLYSDDGYRWYRAYGPMLYRYNQLAGVIKYLRASKSTRQAVLSIYDPSQESFDSVVNNLGKVEARDKSCNNLMYFSYDDKLENIELTISNRSNDVIFGAYSINLPEFTLIQEIVACFVGAGLGDYTVFSNNYHTYRNEKEAEERGNSVAQKQFENVLARNDIVEISNEPDCTLEMNLGKLPYEQVDLAVLKLREMFSLLVTAIHFGQSVESVKEILDRFEIKKASTIYAYAMILIHNKLEMDMPKEEIGNDEILIRAIENSKFTKFKLF